ncbi:paREP2b [Pyrobaculum aerophilum str. IM2]|uniref:PaREP2b n=1 Tax=Pyrobaculum aerophilum (strain ATCC 51768 / DSM 7523 / JCM 9630 / CIP 104966 / NBRC 100827 / IM2) TaxID=178306 RepID=Q8ZWV4_PYRAE|nr:paREP2b [Pyrobaculum aerophilum str. IM2]
MAKNYSPFSAAPERLASMLSAMGASVEAKERVGAGTCDSQLTL